MSPPSRHRLPLAPTHVDLWWMDAHQPGASESELEDALSVPERTNLATLRHPDVRRHRRFFRARQRQILALYTGLNPAAHAFEQGAHGKPFLAGGRKPSFNLTHSGDFGLLAVTGAPAVGIDLEVTTRRTECLALAERFFAPAESAALKALPAARQRTAFFTVWVRKEAWIKALGTGLITPLDDFQVSLDPHQANAWLVHPGTTGKAEEWTFAVPPALPSTECLAAVAVKGQGVTLQWRNYTDHCPPDQSVSKRSSRSV